MLMILLQLGKERWLKNSLIDHFKRTDGGKLELYLGIAFNKREDGVVTMDQSQYHKNKLNEFEKFIGPGGASSPLPPNYQRILIDAEKEDPINYQFPYRQMVGSLMYAMLGTRPDLS
jgi:hypothetical protein